MQVEQVLKTAVDVNTSVLKASGISSGKEKHFIRSRSYRKSSVHSRVNV
jgi:hypothetical protein